VIQGVTRMKEYEGCFGFGTCQSRPRGGMKRQAILLHVSTYRRPGFLRTMA